MPDILTDNYLKPITLPAAKSVPLAVSPSSDRAPRFTFDGDVKLENSLARICRRVGAGIAGIVSCGRLEAVLLGGGYGRGEGGVLRTAAGDQSYNDLEFYIFVRGSTLLNERRYGRKLRMLAHELSSIAGLEVEFKVTSAAQLRRSPVTMFSYDLVSGHRCILGDESLLAGCAHHRRAEAIPPAEAIRLMLNRCTGLLFASERLKRPVFTAEDSDFTGRNLAKVRLALGDAVLATTGRYHWSCRERARRLAELRAPAWWPWFAEVLEQHRRGVEFKLHPRRTPGSRTELRAEFKRVAALAGRLWLWVENRRMHRRMASLKEYAIDSADKYPETPRWRNLLLNVSYFGPGVLAAPAAMRHPRERLLRSLPPLLWEPEETKKPCVRYLLQRELRTPTTDYAGFTTAYRRIWERFR